MKRVGIITFHCTDNFGAVLQCYALQEYIKKEFGFDVEIIDYNPYVICSKFRVMLDWRELKKRCKTRGIMTTLKNDVWKKLGTYNYRKRKKMEFDKFRRKYLNLSKNKFYEISTKNAPIYDFYITGSDQIWNPNLTGGLDEAYFLNFAHGNAVKLSYSASIAETIEERYYKIYRELLKNLDFISVREKAHKGIITDLTDKNVYITLDPTLLLGKNEWMKLVDDNIRIENEYIFLYCLENNESAIQFANQLSEKYKLPIIHYYFGTLKNKLLNAGHCFYFDGPLDFLWYIKNAKFVVTSSFHGTVFSIIFNKSFYTSLCQVDRGTRVIELLSKLGLEDRIIYDGKSKSKPEDSIDFIEPLHNLEVEKNYSKEYLKRAFNIKPFYDVD